MSGVVTDLAFLEGLDSLVTRWVPQDCLLRPKISQDFGSDTHARETGPVR